METEAESVFGKKDWLQTDFQSLPSREELAKLCLSEACLKVSFVRYNTLHFTVTINVEIELIVYQNETI